jgi:predicted N-formylglutamate amidohydrolase
MEPTDTVTAIQEVEARIVEHEIEDQVRFQRVDDSFERFHQRFDRIEFMLREILAEMRR